MIRLYLDDIKDHYLYRNIFSLFDKHIFMLLISKGKGYRHKNQDVYGICFMQMPFMSHCCLLLTLKEALNYGNDPKITISFSYMQHIKTYLKNEDVNVMGHMFIVYNSSVTCNHCYVCHF